MSGGLFKIIKEGSAQLQVPKAVFYNPVQEFNRDISILVLKTFLRHNVWHHKHEEKHVKARGGLMILDALSASGLRSIRYAKELGPEGSIVKKIVANDLSTVAHELIQKNIELNNVQDKVESSLSDASMLLHMSSSSYNSRFHVIDLDPFGTGAPFFDAAVKSIGEAGLLMVTCTDTAVLCGNASESCFARYGSMSLRSEFCHEAALRILLKSLESHATVYGRYIKPLLSISVDFYVRLFVQVFSQPGETKKSASKMSQVYMCKECKTPELLPLGTYKLKDDLEQAKSQNTTVKYQFKQTEVNIGDRCKICGGHYSLGGPLWTDPMHDSEFIEMLKEELSQESTQNSLATFRRLEGIIYMCGEELEVPLHYSIDEMASILRMKMPRTDEILSALVNEGYKVSKAHTNKCAFKTDAPNSIVWDIFCQAAENQKVSISCPLAKRIMSRQRDKVYNFKINPAIESESQKRNLLRFQVNPTREWGPGSRPSARVTDDIQGDKSELKDDSKVDNSKRRKLSDSTNNILIDDECKN